MSNCYFITNGQSYSDWEVYGALILADNVSKTVIDHVINDALVVIEDMYEKFREWYDSSDDVSKKPPLPDVVDIFLKTLDTYGVMYIWYEYKTEMEIDIPGQKGMDALTLDAKLLRLKKIVMERCEDRIKNGETLREEGTIKRMKEKWI